MTKKSTRGSSATKTKQLKIRKRLSLSMLLTAILTVCLLFVINGLCLTGQGLRDSLIIFSSMAMILTTAFFMTSLIKINKK